MRKIILVLAAVIVLVCASCVDAQVYYALYDDNTIETNYAIIINSNELETRSFAQDIKEYWDSSGIDAKIELLDSKVSVVGQSRVGYEDRGNAANAYSDLLTAKDSLLNNVVFEFTPSYETDRFYLSATLTLDDVVRQNEIQDVPQQDLDALLESAKSGEYTFCLSLPGEIVSTNADIVDGQKCIWNLEYGETTDIELETQVTNTENINAYSQLLGRLAQSSMYFRISAVAAGALCLAIVLFVVIRFIKRRQR